MSVDTSATTLFIVIDRLKGRWKQKKKKPRRHQNIQEKAKIQTKRLHTTRNKQKTLKSRLKNKKKRKRRTKSRKSKQSAKEIHEKARQNKYNRIT